MVGKVIRMLHLLYKDEEDVNFKSLSRGFIVISGFTMFMLVMSVLMYGYGQTDIGIVAHLFNYIGMVLGIFTGFVFLVNIGMVIWLLFDKHLMPSY